MKPYFSFLLGILILLGFSQKQLSAQSLAFSKAEFIEVRVNIPPSTNYTTVIGDTNIVVPAGKVLKIESIISGYTATTIPRPLYGRDYFEMFLNNKTIQYSRSTTSNYPTVTYPIWLPAGSYNLKYLYNQGVSSTATVRVFWGISALEFTVVP